MAQRGENRTPVCDTLQEHGPGRGGRLPSPALLSAGIRFPIGPGQGGNGDGAAGAMPFFSTPHGRGRCIVPQSRGMQGDRVARPRKEIDPDQFKKLCELQCTLSEIAGFFDCSEDTIQRWCKREYKERFAERFKKYSAGGKATLRRYQLGLAEKNASMAIWLGKQWLGQRDNTAMHTEGEAETGIVILPEVVKHETNRLEASG